MQQDTTPSQSEAHAVSSFLLVQYVAIGFGLEECLSSYQTDPRVCLLCVFDSGFSPGLFNIKMEASQLYTCTYLLSTFNYACHAHERNATEVAKIWLK